MPVFPTRQVRREGRTAYNGVVVIPDELESILISTPDILGGEVRFAGTRVPVQALLDSLARGRSLQDFLDGFPDVTSQQASAVLDWQNDLSRQRLGLNAA